MESLITSHASIGNSTLKDARDLTGSSLGGPEDFTLNLIDHMRRNKPSFKNPNREQFTTSSFGGPEDFTADIVNHANGIKEGDSLQRSEERVFAPLRRASGGPVKTTQGSPSRSPSHSPRHSPNQRTTGASSAAATKGDGESQSRRPSSPRAKPTSPQGLVESRSSNKLVKETSDDIALDDNGTVSIVVKDGKVYRKNVRAGVRQQMQPTVLDGGEGVGEKDITELLPSPRLNQYPPEPTMSLPLPLLEDDFTKPLGESTPTQPTLDSIVSSKDQTLEDGFDFATSLAHRIQRTPASAKRPEAEYSINLSANASDLLTDGIYRAETFPRNDSFVKDCSDPNVAFADRIRGIRPDNAGTTQPPREPSKVDETELLRQQLEDMKAALAQKDEAIHVLQKKLSAKEAECQELHDALLDKSAAVAAAELRERALKKDVRAAEEKCVVASTAGAERFAIVKDALITAEDEAAVVVERAKDAVAVAESRADAAVSRCRRLEREVRDLTASARAARAEAKRARREQADREALWLERSEILLAECDRRGKALMIKIGEQELPGMRDRVGRQAYRYQRTGEAGRTDFVWR
jgi:hypothetical protein